MKRFLPIIFFLCITRNVLGYSWIQDESIDYEDELSYQELINMNISCYPSDSCMEDHGDETYAERTATGFTCSCHRQCWELGICCIDSPYRGKRPIKKCMNAGVNMNENTYYMVYRCPDNTDIASIWKNECEKEWNGEDDILMLAPVTSLDTSVTYKNYFCFRCHETTDKYVSWDLAVNSIYSDSDRKNVYSVAYNQARKTWMAVIDENRRPVPANLSFQVPKDVEDKAIVCALNIISDCADTWKDRRVLEKCRAFNAVLGYQDLVNYKNAYCAICNYEPLENLHCRPGLISQYDKKILSFKHMLNINDGVEDNVGKSGNCDNDHTWDPYGKKCRKKSCAVPGYVIKDDSCVPS